MRKITASKTTVKAGYSGSFMVKLSSDGNEMGTSFTILYDTNLISITELSTRGLPDGWAMTHDPRNMKDGSIEVIMDGTKPITDAGQIVLLLIVKFKALRQAGVSALTFEDHPTRRSVAIEGNKLGDATWINGQVTVK